MANQYRQKNLEKQTNKTLCYTFPNVVRTCDWGLLEENEKWSRKVPNEFLNNKSRSSATLSWIVKMWWNCPTWWYSTANNRLTTSPPHQHSFCRRYNIRNCKWNAYHPVYPVYIPGLYITTTLESILIEHIMTNERAWSLTASPQNLRRNWMKTRYFVACRRNRRLEFVFDWDACQSPDTSHQRRGELNSSNCRNSPSRQCRPHSVAIFTSAK